MLSFDFECSMYAFSFLVFACYRVFMGLYFPYSALLAHNPHGVSWSFLLPQEDIFPADGKNSVSGGSEISSGRADAGAYVYGGCHLPGYDSGVK